MRIKKLDIFGFKSFANRQTIVFGKGITAVVGPNGCGKSNVVDALRWVMGEQNARHLRGGNMQDVIFCGSEKKAPLGFAEVKLTIENDKQDAPLEYNHFNEIEISRRLYKTGESEYEINKQKARLRDISDFFLGTGVGTKAYAIIEQGRINELISAKPSDRRLIIEEAAGITRYKAKKATAEKRLESTRINLERIIDIKNEVDKRVASLTKEKEKLLEVRALKKRIQEIDVHLASHRFLERSATLNFLKQQKESLDEQLSSHKRDISLATVAFEAILSEYSEKSERQRLLVDLAAQHKSSFELLMRDKEYTKRMLDESRVHITRLSGQLDEIERREQEVGSEIASLTADHDNALAQSDRVKTELFEKNKRGMAVIEARQKSIADERDLQKKLIEAATLAAKLQSQLTALREQDRDRQERLHQAVADHDAKTKALSLCQDQARLLTQELEQIRANRFAFESEVLAWSEKISSAQCDEKNLSDELSRLQKHKIAIASRLRSLQEIDDTHRWSESGIADLLVSDKRDLINGVVADIIKVEPGHEEAIEACLAHLLDCAVIAKQEDLKVLLQVLREQRSATTAFFILAAARDLGFNKPLGLKSLSDVIHVKEERFAPLKEQLSRYFLAPDLDNAFSHWPAARLAQATVVTDDGIMLLPDGRAIASLGQSEQGILRRKSEIDGLLLEIKAVDAQLEEMAERTAIANGAVNEAIEKRLEVQNELDPLKIMTARLEEAVKQKNKEASDLMRDIKDLFDRCEGLRRGNTDTEGLIADLNNRWASALEDHKAHDERLQKIMQNRTAVDLAFDAFQQEVKGVEIEKAGLEEKSSTLSQSLSHAKKNLAHLLLQKKSFEEQIAQRTVDDKTLNDSLIELEKKAVLLQEELQKTTTMLEAMESQVRVLLEQKMAKESALASLRERTGELMAGIHQQELLMNNANNDITNICDRMAEKYRINLIEQIIDFHDRSIDDNLARREMDEYERKRSRLGAVNENADDEFVQYDQRAQFLSAQISDLADALDQLQTAIKKINQTTKMRFSEAFDNINRQFSKVFPRLFNGGKAELVLCNDEDLLTSGIEIIAKPPGKNIGSIELMSGGEKALTAISLIMAIFLIKPSPFCLLDEVDAPLDEVNVSRFSSLIKEMSEESQFIVITHNRKTMESADRLYGVTMEDAGMSKVVSVQVQEAYEALRRKRDDQPLNKPTQLFLDDMVG